MQSVSATAAGRADREHRGAVATQRCSNEWLAHVLPHLLLVASQQIVALELSPGRMHEDATALSAAQRRRVRWLAPAGRSHARDQRWMVQGLHEMKVKKFGRRGERIDKTQCT